MAKATGGKTRKRRKSARKTSSAKMISGFSLKSLTSNALPLLAGVAGLLIGNKVLSFAAANGLGADTPAEPTWKKWIAPIAIFAGGAILFGTMKNTYLKWGAAGVALYGGYKLVNKVAGATNTFFRLNGFYDSPNFLSGADRQNLFPAANNDEYSPSYIN